MFKARKVLCDLHDAVPEERVVAEADNIDLYMVKSDYHRSLYPEIPDEQIKVVSNGIYRREA